MGRKIGDIALFPGEDSFDLDIHITLDGEDMENVNDIWDGMERDVIRLVLKGVLEDLETKKQKEGY